MATQEECTHHAICQPVHRLEEGVKLPYEIYVAIFRMLPTSVVLHRVGAVCKDWHAIVKDDELWRLRCGSPELPSGFVNWFAFEQRYTMREQALDHLYGRGGLTQNWRKGLQLLSVLADAGDDYAMALYGWCLQTGSGIQTNHEHGTQFVQQSTLAMSRACCALHGIGVGKNAPEAYRLLSTECDASDPHVRFLLGWCHRWGFGCTQDRAYAVQCYERAGNHIEAMGSLAWMLCQDNSPSVKHLADHQRAVALARQAATQGHAFAQYHLGLCYEAGVPDVLESDRVQAMHWYKLSPEQGCRAAVKRLSDE